MENLIETVHKMSGVCECGVDHDTTVKDIRIGSRISEELGDILSANGFTERLLIVGDRKTVAAAGAFEKSLSGFRREYHIFDDLRVAEMRHVELIEEIIRGRDISVVAIGTGSIHDPCRLACARQDKKLCLFATAPSMDGFASYSSPIVDQGFKQSYPAKSPEVIIGDTRILAKSPVELKSAGFGDMIAKYVGLCDWKISSLLTGEIYCPKVASLTRNAVDRLINMADKVTLDDENTAGEIFASLIKTGLGMSFMQNSRPASGSEHIIAHLIECLQLKDGIIPNYHGEDIGVCTLEMLEYYRKLTNPKTIHAKKEMVDWDDVYAFYGDMADNVRILNTPDTITDQVTPEDLEKNWAEIRKIVRSVPSAEECRAAMNKAKCKLTVEDIGKEPEFFQNCVKYSPYMRRRLTLLRLKDMII